MPNRFRLRLERIASIVVRITAAFVGLAIFCGDVFFWTSGDLGGHLYSALSLLALSLSPMVGMVSCGGKQSAAALVALHLVATIAITASSNTWGVFPFALIGIDLLMLLAIVREHRAKTVMHHD